jgi:hypothetical protein
MTPEQIKTYLEDNYPDRYFLLIDQFAPAFLGVVVRFTTEAACYDYKKCIEILTEDIGNEEDATEYFEYNVIAAYAEGIPCFLNTV